MRAIKTGLSLVLLTAGLASVPGAQAALAAQPSAPDNSLLGELRDTAAGTVDLSRESSTKKVSFAGVSAGAQGGKADLLPTVRATNAKQAAAKADRYLQDYSAAFGARADELVQVPDVAASDYGWTVSYTQEYRGIPVFGTMLRANLDGSGALTSVNGFAVPGLNLSVDADLSRGQAGKAAVSLVKADPARTEDGHKAATRNVRAVDPTLVVYREGAVRGDIGNNLLAYQVEVTNKANIRDMVILDADTGKLINRWSMGNDALERRLYERERSESALVWKEGDAFPGALNEDQQSMVTSTGEAYWLFRNTFGRDSFDGAGKTMETVNNDPRINCPNANWNGITTNYCDGVSSDDVVAHEWGHAYTEYTSGLIYQWQPGALNESWSDVWGETLDLINNREDEGEGDLTQVREVGSCDPTAPAKLVATITAPADAAGPCAAAIPAAFGPRFTTTPTVADVVVAKDAADAAGPSETDGCSPFSNASAIAGKWAFVDRGTCTFAQKIANATAAGATGIVFGNNVAGLPVSVSGVSDMYGVMVSLNDAARFKAAGQVTLSVQAEDVSGRTATNRWLIGEKSEAFGGAIRDMWNPNCYQDPGKVSDVEYNCDPAMTDSGGVHGNSGVPNHAYALTVDGGTFNGQTVEGIGLDKAANIWFRAQSAYLTPSSDFTDAADSLESACSDLVGQPINKLAVQPDSSSVLGEQITATDCEQVAKVMTAVEMRTEPTQCAFVPMFQTGKPTLCESGRTTTLWSEDFEDESSVADLEQDFEVVYDGGIHAPWEWQSAEDTPEGGSASLFGPAPDQGNCSGEAGDFSSRDSVILPSQTIPEGDNKGLVFSFDHSVATEGGYDGGNVKLKINDGDFAVIPADAYTFNPPRTLATAAEQSTNPLAGEDGFTGTDGGEVTTDWGTSAIDLAAAGVEPGDTITLRFDIGRDGCGGIDGWSVDNMQLVICQVAATTTRATPVRQTIKPRAHATVKVVVSQKGRNGGKKAVPTGTVELRLGDDVLASGDLKRGRATFRVSGRDLEAGRNRVAVVYLGSDDFGASRDSVIIRVH